MNFIASFSRRYKDRLRFSSPNDAAGGPVADSVFAATIRTTRRLTAALSHWYVAALAVAALVHLGILQRVPFALMVDSANVYLPGAEQLLERGLKFFAEPESYHTAPLNFVWPALFFAQPEAIVSANHVLSVGCLLLAFAIGRVLAGLRAGLAAGISYAVSPLIAPLFAHVLSEPLFMFGTSLWLYGTVSVLSRDERKSTMSWAIIGGVISVLTRPVWLPFIALSAAVALVAGKLDRSSPGFRRLAFVNIAILIPVFLYCLHNLSEFGFLGVSTGGGTALYLGNHPLTRGLEPQFFLLEYDVQSMVIPWYGQYLSVEADRALRAIGWSMIRDRSFAEQIDWFLLKIGAVLFFTKIDFAPDLYSIRALRVFELILAGYGLALIRPRPLQLLLAGAFLVQLGQLAFLLYNRRYSVGSLEILLIVLSGCGVARLLAGIDAKVWRVPRGIRGALDFAVTRTAVARNAAIVVAVVAGIGVAHWHRRLSDPLEADVDRAPTRTLMELLEPQPDPQRSANLAPLPNGAHFVTAGEGMFAIRIDDSPALEPGFNYLWTLTMTIVPPEGKSCRGGHISFEADRPLPGSRFESIPIAFKGDGKLHQYAISAAFGLSPLFVASPGILRFRPSCPAATQVGIHRIALLQSVAYVHYLSRVKLP